MEYKLKTLWHKEYKRNIVNHEECLSVGNSEEDEQKLLLNELWKQIVIQFSRFLMGWLTKLKTEGYRVGYRVNTDSE